MMKCLCCIMFGLFSVTDVIAKTWYETETWEPRLTCFIRCICITNITLILQTSMYITKWLLLMCQAKCYLIWCQYTTDNDASLFFIAVFCLLLLNMFFPAIHIWFTKLCLFILYHWIIELIKLYLLFVNKCITCKYYLLCMLQLLIGSI